MRYSQQPAVGRTRHAPLFPRFGKKYLFLPTEAAINRTSLFLLQTRADVAPLPPFFEILFPTHLHCCVSSLPSFRFAGEIEIGKGNNVGNDRRRRRRNPKWKFAPPPANPFFPRSLTWLSSSSPTSPPFHIRQNCAAAAAFPPPFPSIPNCCDPLLLLV